VIGDPRQGACPATVSGRHREADEPAFVGAMSSAYHRTDAGWKLALYQQTQISD
jgi:hypothetical protein